ncbi:MAG TPA: response regulator [Nitrospira sp.]
MLVVDDEESIRTLLRTVLKRKKREVFLADSGPKGIDLFERMHPLITILDLHLPDLNGLEVLSRLRADPRDHVDGIRNERNGRESSDPGDEQFFKKMIFPLRIGRGIAGDISTHGPESRPFRSEQIEDLITRNGTGK